MFPLFILKSNKIKTFDKGYLKCPVCGRNAFLSLILKSLVNSYDSF